MAAGTLSADPALIADPRDLRWIIFASIIGSMIEWYDFSIYGTAATLVFNKLFFPTVIHSSALWSRSPPTGSVSSLARSGEPYSGILATASVARCTVGPGFDGTKNGLQGSDWARLELDGAIPDLVAPLGITSEPPRPGVAIALAGYNQDRAQILMADLVCHISGTLMAAGRVFIAHDCDATRGTSGGPLLVRQKDGWAVIGVNIGAAAETNLALPTTAFAY